jgi:hypothetical protein
MLRRLIASFGFLAQLLCQTEESLIMLQFVNSSCQTPGIHPLSTCCLDWLLRWVVQRFGFQSQTILGWKLVCRSRPRCPPYGSTGICRTPPPAFWSSSRPEDSLFCCWMNLSIGWRTNAATKNANAVHKGIYLFLWSPSTFAPPPKWSDEIYINIFMWQPSMTLDQRGFTVQRFVSWTLFVLEITVHNDIDSVVNNFISFELSISYNCFDVNFDQNQNQRFLPSDLAGRRTTRTTRAKTHLELIIKEIQVTSKAGKWDCCYINAWAKTISEA